jgi:hypothetical protein
MPIGISCGSPSSISEVKNITVTMGNITMQKMYIGVDSSSPHSRRATLKMRRKGFLFSYIIS